MSFNYKKFLIYLLIFLAVGTVTFYIKNLLSRSLSNQSSASAFWEEAKKADAKLAKQLQKTDKDLDGLSDEQEKRLGLNPNSIDTDGDGLFDYQEINLYKTDPKNGDTDGDGMADGSEVIRGRDPKKADKK